MFVHVMHIYNSDEVFVCHLISKHHILCLPFLMGMWYHILCLPFLIGMWCHILCLPFCGIIVGNIRGIHKFSERGGPNV